MQLAAIDIGTNSIHMIICKVAPDGSFEVIDREKDMIRLGAGSLGGRILPESSLARAMQTLSRNYPNDLDAAAMYAEAMMDLRPWNYWQKDGRPYPGTAEFVATLERVLRTRPNHPGASGL